MPEPTIIVASIAAGVSIFTAGGTAWVRRRDKAAAESSTVEVARLGDDATIREQLHSWLESERDNHHQCLAEVAQVRAEFLTFQAQHPNCRERLAEMSRRVRHLEARSEAPGPAE